MNWSKIKLTSIKWPGGLNAQKPVLFNSNDSDDARQLSQSLSLRRDKWLGWEQPLRYLEQRKILNIYLRTIHENFSDLSVVHTPSKYIGLGTELFR